MLMKYTLQQADDLARSLKTTRKGRKFLRKLTKFIQLWQEDALADARARAAGVDRGPSRYRGLLESLAADIDSEFKK